MGKRSKKMQAVLFAVLILLASLSGCTANQAGETSGAADDEALTADAFLALVKEKASNIEQYTDYKTEAYQTVTLEGSTISFSGTGAEVDGNTITITEAGTYEISGILDDGRIIVNSEDDENVRLVFNNAEITSSNGPPIYVKSAENTIVSLPPGTENELSDGSENTYDEDANGTLFSADDLWINGSGILRINANYKDGISGNDDLEITQVNLIIAAADDGISANDSVSVSNADITVEAGGDGIKATNDTEAQKGWLAVVSGSFDITTATDALQAETLLYIQDGDFRIDSAADSVHSNDMIRVDGGTFEIQSDDDAFHADNSLAVTGGDIMIAKSYEGIESKVIELSGGTIDLTASDDGINIAGGNGGGMEGQPGGGSAPEGGPGEMAAEGSQDEVTTQGGIGEKMADNSEYMLTISGGDIRINAEGDGIDSNGSIYMTGGTVLVNGPTGNGNGALDYTGVFEISGGTLLAAGSAGMAMAPSDGSTQYTVSNTVGSQAAGTEVRLADSSGKTVASFTPAKAFQHVVISSPDLKNGSTYTLYTGSTKISDITVSSVVSGDSANGRGQGGMMQPGGGWQGGPGQGGMPGGPGGGVPPDGGAPEGTQPPDAIQQ